MTDKSLAQLYSEHTGKVSDKWSSYLVEYDRIFPEYRTRPIRMLEIGIQNGGSLEIWSKYFPQALRLVGCDINPDCSKLEYDDPRISVVVGDANVQETQDRVLDLSPVFDIVIDDGSHLSSDIVKSFARYFPRIAAGGVFIAEDLHCGYWTEFGGGLAAPFSCITFFKHFADIVNYQHWGVDRKRQELLQGFCAEYDIVLDESVLAQVHSIEFVNSICVVRKSSEQNNKLGERYIAGLSQLVVSGHFELSQEDTLCVTPTQMANPWSLRKLPPIEELPLKLREIEFLEVKLAGMEASKSWRLTRPLRALVRRLKRLRKYI